MCDLSRQIRNVLLRVAVDLGHGGPLSEYRIDADKDGYAVTLRISGPVSGSGAHPLPPQPPSQTPRPLPNENRSTPAQLTETLAKDRRQVEEFLEKLSTEFKVYEMTDLKPPYPFLHPTFYSFSFLDDDGETHGFVYQIECSNHLDEKYRRLVQEFERFFESSGVFDHVNQHG
jgi:hypothetical protein